MYAEFLEANMDEFKSEKNRRSKKFFKKMGQHLNNSRDNEQCRSHHQKMVKKFGKVKKIIEAFVKTREDNKKADDHLRIHTDDSVQGLESEKLGSSLPESQMMMLDLNEYYFEEPSDMLFKLESLPFIQ